MSTVVTTRKGKIKGCAENGCLVFKGIPYAKPPVGALRFHKPLRPDPWEGVYRHLKRRVAVKLLFIKSIPGIFALH